MMGRPRHPRLVRLEPTITLLGHRCRRCDRRAFPPDPYGCEGCGADADQLDPVDLRPAGVIHALATVHRHHRELPATPFTVATIVLDDGITLKAILEPDGGDTEPAIGDRVTAVAVPGPPDDDGDHVVDLSFQRR